MTSADLRVIAALDRRGNLDEASLRRATQLAEATLDVTVRKLTRMRLVVCDHDRLRLTPQGKRKAKSLRTAE